MHCVQIMRNFLSIPLYQFATGLRTIQLLFLYLSQLEPNGKTKPKPKLTAWFVNDPVRDPDSVQDLLKTDTIFVSETRDIAEK
jgi:hypothetical protein